MENSRQPAVNNIRVQIWMDKGEPMSINQLEQTGAHVIYIDGYNASLLFSNLESLRDFNSKIEKYLAEQDREEVEYVAPLANITA